MKIILRTKTFEDHKGIPGHHGGSLPRNSGTSSGGDDEKSPEEKPKRQSYSVEAMRKMNNAPKVKPERPRYHGENYTGKRRGEISGSSFGRTSAGNRGQYSVHSDSIKVSRSGADRAQFVLDNIGDGSDYDLKSYDINWIRETANSLITSYQDNYEWDTDHLYDRLDNLAEVYNKIKFS